VTRDVHVVVVAFEAPDRLAEALDGLDGKFAVTVVDNSSSGEVAEVARSRKADYVDPGANLGFAAGANVALYRIAGSGPDVLLLNPDAVITPAEIAKLSAALHAPACERCGAIAPRLVDSGGDQRVLWPFPSPLRAWVDALGVGERLRSRATFAVGAVLLLRREALEEVGVFDERFFLYAEEADWQRRAYALGWTAAVCRDAVARHAGAGTSHDPRRREALFHAGQETYIRKWFGTRGWWLYRTGVVCGAAGRALVLRAERRRAAARRAVLYVRGPRRLAGFTTPT
jgi:GT2 family glycosyltransferase